jgi:hypothetical protein
MALRRAVTSTGAPETAGKYEEARQIIKLLMKFGADPRLKNKIGKTPADYVRDKDLLRLLKCVTTAISRRGVPPR